MQAAVKAVSGGKATLDVKLVQLVRLLRAGEPVKMSKRSGDFVTLREVVNEFAPAVTGVLMIKPRAAGVLQEPPLTVQVETTAGGANDGLAERIRARIRDKLLVTTDIQLVAAGSLPRSEYKSKLVERIK